MAHGFHLTHIEDPGGVSIPQKLRPFIYGAAALGLVLWLIGFITADASFRPWEAMLLSYFYFMMLGLGGIVFVSIQYAANARWSIVVRRIAEGMAAFIPWSFGIFLVIAIFGYHSLYDMASGDTKVYDPLKRAMISQPGVIIKGVIFYAIWHLLSTAIRKNSLQQDKTKDASLFQKNQKLSIIFLLLFGYTFTLHTMDMLMALEPRWFSTMFGVYCFSGMFLSTMCVISLVAHAMRRRRIVGDAIQARHLYDLGTWIMAFSVFMCYVGFSQYMLIWYANIPEETFYIIIRSENGWEFIFAALPFLKWLVPFALLMPQGFRANATIHVIVAVAVFLGQWLDLYWIIYPTHHMAPIMPGLPELGSFLVCLGAFGICIDRVYASNSVLPMGDPYLKTSVNGSYL